MIEFQTRSLWSERFNRCFDQLQANPYNHPKIKRLRGSFVGRLHYRIGDW